MRRRTDTTRVIVRNRVHAPRGSEALLVLEADESEAITALCERNESTRASFEAR